MFDEPAVCLARQVNQEHEQRITAACTSFDGSVQTAMALQDHLHPNPQRTDSTGVSGLEETLDGLSELVERLSPSVQVLVGITATEWALPVWDRWTSGPGADVRSPALVRAATQSAYLYLETGSCSSRALEALYDDCYVPAYKVACDRSLGDAQRRRARAAARAAYCAWELLEFVRELDEDNRGTIWFAIEAAVDAMHPAGRTTADECFTGCRELWSVFQRRFCVARPWGCHVSLVAPTTPEEVFAAFMESA